MMADTVAAHEDGGVFFLEFVRQHPIAIHASVDKGR